MIAAGSGKSVLVYVDASYIPMILTLLLGPLSSTPSRMFDEREKSLLFSIVTFETSVPRVLRKHCALYSPSYYINFIGVTSIPEA